MDGSADPDVRAFLIADVRGYTSFTQEHGDEGAARLAARFAEVTRSLVEQYRGHVVELRGDEALVVFGSPRSAIRAAVALQQRFVDESITDPSLPLTVGIGLDAGEAVAVEGGYRGGALNVAGRLQARAQAGEVLASREIIHLARRIDGIRFTERGQADLKGLDQPVHVIAVRSEHRDAAEAMARFVRSAAPAADRKRLKVAAAVAAFAMLVALIAIPLVRRVGGSSEIMSNSIGILDPESGELVSTLRLEARPGSIAASGDDVWVTNPDAGIVRQIDREERAVVDSYRVGENPTGIVVSEGAAWVLESGGPSVSKISPSTNDVVTTIEVGNGPAEIAVGEEAVWVTNRFDGTLSRIDPDRGRVVKTISVGADPQGVAVGFDSVWVSLAGSSMVVRIDPQTNSVMQSIGVGNAPGSLAVSADAVWVANSLDDTISEVDPQTNTVIDTIEVGDSPSEMAVVEGAVWVANEADGTISKIEPGAASGSTTTIGSVPQGMAGVGDELWVSVRGVATSHRGGTLRLLGNYTPESLDPSGAYDSAAWMVLHMLGDGLVATEPVGGASGALVPDLSTSIPVPTDGGKTYTFELRRGIRYSNGEVVEPIDFRRGIERVFRLEPFAHFLFQGIVGGDACHDEPRTCDLSQGIEIDSPEGTAITFNLVDPDPEFLYKLSLPLSYPVPPSVPDEEQVRTGIPGTGPYTLDAPVTDGGLSLVRNPFFRVWSSAAQPDGYADRIEWTFGVSTRDQVEAVAAGDADLTFDVARTARLDDVFVRFPGQVHSSPNPQTLFIVLDTRSPPFDDVDVRRAMNLVIDRDRLVQIFGGDGAMRPTCQQLPQNFPGYQPYCPYTAEPGPGGEGTWAAPGASIDEARAIVRRSGTAGMRVVFEYPPEYWPQGADMGRYMDDLLDKVGYRGSVRPVPLGAFFDPGNEFQMALAAWTSDYPAASNFINGWLTCDAALTPSSGFCDPGIDEKIDEASKTQIDDPIAAQALWSEIDRAIVDRAPYVWIANRNIVNLVSERVGNYQFSPQWGTLLNQLWVR